MKATVTMEFDLDDPEQREKFEELTGNKSSNLRCAMHKFAEQTLRKYRKYGGIENEIKIFAMARAEALPTNVAEATVEFIEKEFYAALAEYDATLE